MTISRIEVNEYQCVKCGYKWINRINGKDGPIPKRCAKCKCQYWGSDPGPMTPKESGLRRRIKGMKKLYGFIAFPWGDPSLADCWDSELAEEFLNLNPRPTIAELKHALYGPDVILRLNSQNTARQYIPDLERPGHIKYDDKERIKFAKQDAQKQQEQMRQMIKERNSDSAQKERDLGSKGVDQRRRLTFGD